MANAPGSPRRLALFDLDGTLSRRDTFLPFAAGLLWRHPARWPRLALLAWPALGYLLRRIDRGALKGAVIHLLFAGLPRPTVADWARRYAQIVVPGRMFADAVSAFRQHLAEGDHVVLLSASPDLFVPEIGRELGAHEVICTAIRWEADRLDGRLAGPNRRDHEKARVLAALRAAHPGLPVIAYGNSPPDLIHMQHCEAAVYVNAAPALAASLGARGMRCVSWR
jgi:phosphatidylglycerophosphatase C